MKRKSICDAVCFKARTVIGKVEPTTTNTGTSLDELSGGLPSSSAEMKHLRTVNDLVGSRCFVVIRPELEIRNEIKENDFIS